MTGQKVTVTLRGVTVATGSESELDGDGALLRS